MKNHRASATEIAAAVNVTDRAIRQRAINECWPFEEKAVRGGRRRLYDISSLPANVQAALAEQHLSTRAARQAPGGIGQAVAGAGSTPEARSTSTRGSVASRVLAGAACAPATSDTLASSSTLDPRYETLAAHFDAKPESAKAEARVRLDVVREYHALLARGFDREAVVGAVLRERQVSAATLWRYLGMVRGKPEHLWLQLLCPAYCGRTSRAELCAEAWETLKGDYLRGERTSASACIKRLRDAAPARGWTLPSTRTLLRRLEALPRALKVLKRDGPTALKALYPAQQRDKSGLFALQIVNADGYEHNVWARFPDGEVCRPKTWFWQDVYSSKILTWRTDKTEHTEVIQLSFGDLCERYGVPHAATIDNTMAAANKTMSGGVKHRFRFKVREDEPDGVFKLLGVDVHWATPRHGQAKPIERAFGHGGIGEYVDKAPEFAGAWTGSSPKDKPEYDGRRRAVDLADLEAVIVREVERLNSMPGRRSVIHQGRSFDEVFNASFERVEIRRATEAQRRLWLLSTEPVRANSRDGSLTLDAGRVRGERLANRYWSQELLDHAGRSLVAKLDPRRLHEGVHVYTLDGRWLCYAPCDRPAGFNDANAGRERNRARNAWQRGVKQQAQLEVRMSTLDAAKTLQLPSAGGAAHSTIPAPRVVRGMFVDPLERPRYQPSERSAEERADMERLEAELAAPAAVNVLELRSDADKHAHWRSLAARLTAGEQLGDQEAAFHAAWQGTDYYRIAFEAEREFDQRMANG